MVIQIILTVIIISILYALCTYSQEGDIKTLTRSIPKSIPKTKRECIERMHSLLIYKLNYVRWPIYLGISLFCSVVINYYFQNELRIASMIILTAFLFLAMELPCRWLRTHVNSSVSHEGSMLFGTIMKK